MSNPSSSEVFKKNWTVQSAFAYATSVFLQLSKNKNMYTQNYMYVNSPPVASQSKLNRSWKRWHLFLKHAQQITKIAKPVNPGISNSEPLLLHRKFPSHAATKLQVNINMPTAPQLGTEKPTQIHCCKFRLESRIFGMQKQNTNQSLQGSSRFIHSWTQKGQPLPTIFDVRTPPCNGKVIRKKKEPCWTPSKGIKQQLKDKKLAC